MSIRFQCPGCGKSYTVPNDAAGRSGTCKNCGGRFQVPAPATSRRSAPSSRKTTNPASATAIPSAIGQRYYDEEDVAKSTASGTNSGGIIAFLLVVVLVVGGIVAIWMFKSSDNNEKLWEKATNGDLPALRALAEKGDALAQMKLSRRYEEGDGMPRNSEEALKWCRKAAEQGDPDAQYVMGLYYSNGRVVAKDKVEANRWFQKAAKQGNSKAKEEILKQ